MPKTGAQEPHAAALRSLKSAPGGEMVFKKYPPGDFQGGGRCKEGDIYIRPPPIVIFSLKRAVEA